MRGFSPHQIAHAVWNLIALAARAVNVTNIDGVSLGTHGSGQFPSDVRQVDGTALGSHVSGQLPADTRSWNGTAVASPHTAGYPVVTVKVGTGTGEINLSGGGVPIAAGSYSIRASSCQRSTDAWASGDADADVSLSSVTMTRANGCGSSRGPTAASETDISRIHATHQLASSTIFRITRGNTGQTGTGAAEVWEFF